MKRILHIDMNSYFASCELMGYKDIFDVCLAVVGRAHKRQEVISAASYGARKRGVKAAMTLTQALKLCPELKTTEVRMDFYKETSDKIMDFIKAEFKIIEQASIDEAYVDITDNIKSYGSELNLAKNLQKQIRNRFNLPCSIGIGDNKIQAKMSSNKKKPQGITIINTKTYVGVFGTDNISKVHGIGKKSQEKYYKDEIYTINDALKISHKEWQRRRYNLDHYLLIRGESTNILDQSRFLVNKSISNETTLPDDIVMEEEVFKVFEKVFERSFTRLKNKQYLAKTVSVKVRFFDFSQKQKSHTLSLYTNDRRELMDAINALVTEIVDFEKPIRLVSCGFSTLVTKSEYENKYLRYFHPFENILKKGSNDKIKV